jgi:chorismate lyase/3-hydroxybenzoate synthase
MTSGVAQFGLAYLNADDIWAYLEKHREHVLGVVGFGHLDILPALSCSATWIDIPVMGRKDRCFEVWTSDAPTTDCEHAGLRGRQDGKVLFGAVSLEQQPGETLEMLAEQAYMRIFAFTDHFGYRHLLRVWHYIPQINDDEHGMERYRGFNVGRHTAFVANGRTIGEENVPAASVLGSDGGSFTVYFIAGKLPGRAVENPRQISAYNYPQLYGPRSPIFVRALSVTLGGQQCFLISGTASIVGHETLHRGDVDKQTAETLINIRTLLDEFPHYQAGQGRMLFKVYVRHPHDLAMVQDKVHTEFGADYRAVYLRSNICRADLLLEIEGAYFREVQ